MQAEPLEPRPSWKISTSRPKAALTVRRFISSAFTGSTTEPVIANRMTSVVVARIASASGSEPPIECCWSTNPAVSPPTCTGNGTSSPRTSSTTRWARSDSAAPSGTTS